MPLSRRALTRFLALSAAMAGTGVRFGSGAAHAAGPAIDHQAVVDIAERLARDPFQPPRQMDQHGLADLSYDQYRDIRYRTDRALWRGEGRRFEIDLLHTGFHYRRPVDISVVEDGTARGIAFARELFDYGPRTSPPPSEEGLAFSGFRARHPLNSPDRIDDVVVFQGASYFRAVAAGQRFGLAARGLGINTAEADGEEFPHFRTFWLTQPAPGADSLTAFALLDSPSTTGAYRFTVRPGAATVIDVDLVLFPRWRIDKIGLAPLTSMFLFDATARAGHDDYRNAVHDSNALQIHAGSGERILRPLANPARLQISAFMDHNPRGFGLVQRSRRFTDFQDLEARYDLRPSAWVEPVGDWGPGAVILVEIPTESETNDNIVAFWRPSEPVEPPHPFRLRYRLHWCAIVPDAGGRARVVGTRCGLSADRQRRLFVVEFAGLPAEIPAPIAELSASSGEIVNVVGRTNPATGGFRVSFELDPGDETLVELRLVLVGTAGPMSETWLYRWTSS